ncbi:MAG: peptidoglycan editing factor PgeF [Sporomusaceae bacterium]|nr:peptidoglycan editing factor PgeF [Sporomusaceae bacterium]
MNEQFVLRHANNGIWYGVFSHFAAHGLVHGVSTRLNGCSEAPWQSLNLGLHCGDCPPAVTANRDRFAAAVGFDAAAAVTAQQVHEDTVAIITRDGGDYRRAIAATDALVTAEPNIPLMLFFADCVPVLFFDPVRRVAAVTHAGWRGTVARIAAKTLQRLQAEFRVDPRDCLVGIGPSIGQCCYEVDAAVIDRLRREFSDWQEFVTPAGDRWRLDLWEVNRRQLIAAGAADANIIVSGICTACNRDLFYSYRADGGRTGRLGAVIQL